MTKSCSDVVLLGFYGGGVAMMVMTKMTVVPLQEEKLSSARSGTRGVLPPSSRTKIFLLLVVMYASCAGCASYRMRVKTMFIFEIGGNFHHADGQNLTQNIRKTYVSSH